MLIPLRICRAICHIWAMRDACRNTPSVESGTDSSPSPPQLEMAAKNRTRRGERENKDRQGRHTREDIPLKYYKKQGIT